MDNLERIVGLLLVVVCSCVVVLCWRKLRKMAGETSANDRLYGKLKLRFPKSRRS